MRARSAAIGTALQLRQTIEDRQRESSGLAGAGLGDAEQVTALQEFGNGRCLDRRGCLIASLVQCFEERRVEAKVLK